MVLGPFFSRVLVARRDSPKTDNGAASTSSPSVVMSRQIARDTTLNLAEHRVGRIASPLVLFRRHVGHVAAGPRSGLACGDDRRLAIIGRR